MAVKRVICRLLLLGLLTGCGGGGGGGAADEVGEQADPDAGGTVAFAVEEVALGLDHPWGLAFLPDGRLLVTERPGRLNLIDLSTGERALVEGVPEVAAVGQGGLLDVVLHPRFAETRWVYLSYTAGGDRLSTRIGRGRLEGTRLWDFETLFVATPTDASGEHFGGRLTFDGAGYLYLGLGDRGERGRAQDLADHNGSLIRLQEDGTPPVDNPFVGRDDARGEIYSYGHRNIQGLAVHPTTGRVWISEHGPKGGDEINLPQAGANYGWPVISYGEEYDGGAIGPAHQEGMQQPVHYWAQSVAPSGVVFYSGTAFPAWSGDLFVATLAGRQLVRLRLDGESVVEEQRLLTQTQERLRDVAQGPDGLLYLLVDDDDAPILRLRPAQ